MNSRILLLGVSGQVGSYIKELLPSESDVICAASPRSATASDLIIDLTNSDQIRQKVREVLPGIIINAAAYTAVDKAESEPALAHQINAHAPKILAEEVAKIGGLLIHFSSDYVFDGKGDRPWQEDDTPNPLSVYGQSKCDGEAFIRKAWDHHLIIRTSWIVSDRGQNFVKTMLKLAEARPELAVVNDQYGAPASAKHLAQATIKMIEHYRQQAADSESFPFGTYHLTSAGVTTWHEIALEVFARARNQGLPLKIGQVAGIPATAYPTAAVRPQNSRLDCRKFCSTFGWQPKSWNLAIWEIVDALVGATETNPL